MGLLNLGTRIKVYIYIYIYMYIYPTHNAKKTNRTCFKLSI